MEENSVPELLLKQKAEILQELAAGPLASSLATLSATSRAIPSDKDFHYFYNFDEFKVPVKEIAKKSELILKDIGSSKSLWAEQLIFPTDFEDAYEWLVNINDEVFERFDVSMDEFQRSRKKEEGKNGRGIGSVDSDGFQMIYGKKKKGILRKLEDIEVRDSSSLTSVKMASRDDKTTAARSHVPFHIPSIPRPQDEYNILVDNSNKSFKHVLLQKTEDGSRFIHPLEKFSELDFVDRNIGEVESVKPLPIESTPFTLVERIEDLKELAAKLRAVNEFAVDLEHNQYRSFQGLTCLMQISTRMEDFVVDTLKLRAHIGPHLREAFKDPSKKKVMHGADRDIIWLQRDFSIYVCNLFDTGQASRVLQLERNSLEYLLLHFCGVTANKEYQNADWRLRPLPDEMLKYAREDTHYLLYIYDLMRGRLLSASTDSENGNDLLLEVYKRSYDICMQLYEKELLTDASYLHIYGLNGANFNSQQLAIVAGLCKWRDAVARAEDESTGYILPNKALLEIARQMPVASGKLRWLVKSKYPYVERKLGSVISIIRSSIENADAFESAAEHLNEGQEETASLQEAMDDGSEPILVPEDPTSLETASTQAEIGDPINGQRGKNVSASVSVKVECLEQASTVHGRCSQEDRQPSMSSSEMLSREDEKVKTRQDCCPPEVPKGNVFFSGQMSNVGTETSHSAKAAPAASVQVLKKPSRAFGALLGNSTSKRKLNRDPKGCSLEQDKFGMKVEQIKSSVMLPFHSFDGTSVRSTEPVKFFEFSHPEIKPKLIDDDTISLCKLEDIISLENDSDNPESSEIPEPENGSKHRKWYPQLPEMDTQEEPGSLSDLSSNFQKCFESINEMRNTKQTERRSQESNSYFQLKPFDYAGARKQMRFEEKEGQAPFKKDGQDKTKTPPDAKETRTSSVSVRVSKEEGKKVFLQGRRRQAFPSSGNRSSTFR